jgi:hypothetical protein
VKWKDSHRLVIMRPAIVGAGSIRSTLKAGELLLDIVSMPGELGLSKQTIYVKRARSSSEDQMRY